MPAPVQFAPGLFYTPPGDEPPNVFAAWASRFMARRTSWTDKVFAARLAQMNTARATEAMIEVAKIREDLLKIQADNERSQRNDAMQRQLSDDDLFETIYGGLQDETIATMSGNAKIIAAKLGVTESQLRASVLSKGGEAILRNHQTRMSAVQSQMASGQLSQDEGLDEIAAITQQTAQQATNMNRYERSTLNEAVQRDLDRPIVTDPKTQTEIRKIVFPQFAGESDVTIEAGGIGGSGGANAGRAAQLFEQFTGRQFRGEVPAPGPAPSPSPGAVSPSAHPGGGAGVTPPANSGVGVGQGAGLIGQQASAAASREEKETTTPAAAPAAATAGDPIASELDRLARLTETSRESGQRDPGFFDPLPGARGGSGPVTAENFRARLVALQQSDPEAFAALGKVGERSAGRADRKGERQERREERQSDRERIQGAPRGERRELRQGLRRGRGEEGTQAVDGLRVAFEQQAEDEARKRMGARQVEAVEEQAARGRPAPTEPEGGRRSTAPGTTKKTEEPTESISQIIESATPSQSDPGDVVTGPSLDLASASAQDIQRELMGKGGEEKKPRGEGFVKGMQEMAIEDSPFPRRLTEPGAELFDKAPEKAKELVDDRVSAARRTAAQITGPQVAPAPKSSEPEKESGPGLGERLASGAQSILDFIRSDVQGTIEREGERFASGEEQLTEEELERLRKEKLARRAVGESPTP